MTRHQLGDTVEELVARTDVKARARAQMAELKGAASGAAHSVRERAPRAVVIGGVSVAAAAAVTGAMAWRRHDTPRVLLHGRRRSSSSALRRDVARRVRKTRHR
jgi:hypothetical protein